LSCPGDILEWNQALVLFSSASEPLSSPDFDRKLVTSGRSEVVVHTHEPVGGMGVLESSLQGAFDSATVVARRVVLVGYSFSEFNLSFTYFCQTMYSDSKNSICFVCL
jgi:hypothetical protein